MRFVFAVKQASWLWYTLDMEKKYVSLVIVAAIAVFLMYTVLSFVKINIKDPLSALGIKSPAATEAEQITPAE